MAEINEWNKSVIAEFRANGGRVGGQYAGRTLLLLHTTGARSGEARVNPLSYARDGDQLVLIASAGGSSTHPDWYFNVLANPEVTVEVGGEQFQAHATIQTEPERTRLFDQVVAVLPHFGDYQRKTTRTLPVVTLRRSD